MESDSSPNLTAIVVDISTQFLLPLNNTYCIFLKHKRTIIILNHLQIPQTIRKRKFERKTHLFTIRKINTFNDFHSKINSLTCE